jgi:hypothetical protein
MEWLLYIPEWIQLVVLGVLFVTALLINKGGL